MEPITFLNSRPSFPLLELPEELRFNVLRSCSSAELKQVALTCKGLYKEAWQALKSNYIQLLRGCIQIVNVLDSQQFSEHAAALTNALPDQLFSNDVEIGSSFKRLEERFITYRKRIITVLSRELSIEQLKEIEQRIREDKPHLARIADVFKTARFDSVVIEARAAQFRGVQGLYHLQEIFFERGLDIDRAFEVVKESRGVLPAHSLGLGLFQAGRLGEALERFSTLRNDRQKEDFMRGVATGIFAEDLSDEAIKQNCRTAINACDREQLKILFLAAIALPGPNLNPEWLARTITHFFYSDQIDDRQRITIFFYFFGRSREGDRGLRWLEFLRILTQQGFFASLLPNEGGEQEGPDRLLRHLIEQGEVSTAVESILGLPNYWSAFLDRCVQQNFFNRLLQKRGGEEIIGRFFVTLMLQGDIDHIFKFTREGTVYFPYFLASLEQKSFFDTLLKKESGEQKIELLLSDLINQGKINSAFKIARMFPHYWPLFDSFQSMFQPNTFNDRVKRIADSYSLIPFVSTVTGALRASVFAYYAIKNMLIVFAAVLVLPAVSFFFPSQPKALIDAIAFQAVIRMLEGDCQVIRGLVEMVPVAGNLVSWLLFNHRAHRL